MPDSVLSLLGGATSGSSKEAPKANYAQGATSQQETGLKERVTEIIPR